MPRRGAHAARTLAVRAGAGILDGPIIQAVDTALDAHARAVRAAAAARRRRLAAALTGDPWLLVIAHRLLAVARAARSGLGGAPARLVGRVRRSRRLGAGAGQPADAGARVGGVHNDLLMVGLAAVALVAARYHGWAAGARLGGLAAAVKVPGGLVCIGVALLSLAGHRDAARPSTPAGAGRGGQRALAAGRWAGWRVSARAGSTRSTCRPRSTPRCRSPRAERARARHQVRRHLAALGMAAAVALRWPTGSPGGAVRATALRAVRTVLLSPVVHAWYAAVVPADRGRLLPRAAAAARRSCGCRWPSASPRRWTPRWRGRPVAIAHHHRPGGRHGGRR